MVAAGLATLGALLLAVLAARRAAAPVEVPAACSTRAPGAASPHARGETRSLLLASGVGALAALLAYLAVRSRRR
jgi:hypothetical protein